jgi:photosystem II stability/assembly factor-like uncharacterized protein
MKHRGMTQARRECTMRSSLRITVLAIAASLALSADGIAQGTQRPHWDAFTYRNVGPTRGGRVTAVAGHRAQPSNFYMGATGGGVWKTTDYGLTWRNVSDGYIETGSIGAIRVADSDSNVVWVGTGSDGIRSNVIVGRGVYRSTNGGETWAFLGLRGVGQVGAVLIHPTNPNVVFVAALGSPFGPTADRGVYRTRDGGKNWQRVLFVSDSTGAIDLEFAPDDPRTVYASMWRGERKPWTIISGAREGGLYRSTNGGETWKKLSRGLPGGLIGKSDLAVSPADPNRVYALIEAPEPDDGLYRSDDRGETWRLVTSYNPILNRPFYYTNVDADPSNADIVYVNNEGFFKSSDGGVNWERLQTPHGDNHDMWINPDNSQVFIQSNDGGANVTLNGGLTWSSQHNQPTAELYQVDVDDQFPYWLYAGQQDNTTVGVPSLPPYFPPSGAEGYWLVAGGCETGPAVPQPGNPDIVFANCKGRFGRYNKKTGQEQQYYVGAQNLYGHNPKDLIYRFQRTVPIEVSPHDPNTVYHGSQFVHMTRDGGRTWETISPDLTAFKPQYQTASGSPITRDITGEEHYSTLYVIEESPLERGVIWAGANDGLVHMTRDGGKTWTNVTPSGLPPDGRVNRIDPSTHRPGKSYIAAYRFQLNDWQPYIYRTLDYGQTWKLLTMGTNGIPADYPTRVVREDPDREGLLYAGTEFGMFVSMDDGETWEPFQQNLPVVPITDIRVVRKDLAISTMGRSFWVLDDVTPLHQLDRQVIASPAHLFEPRDAYRMRYRVRGFRVNTATDPEYPEPGAMIYYSLANEPAGEVTLEILSAQGSVIRSFSSEGLGELLGVEQGMRAPELTRAGTPTLEKRAGLHRFLWDLRYPGPWSDDEDAGEDGPLAVPGMYQARLTVGTWSATQRFEVKMDPRIAADGVSLADLQEQFDLNRKIRDAITEAKMALVHTQRGIERLEQQGGASGATQRLERIEARLATASGGGIRYPQPMLIRQLEYLYDMTTTADQKPGRDAHLRHASLRQELDEILNALQDVPGMASGDR